MNKDRFIVSRFYLKVKEVMAARAAPFDRVTVSKTSAGIIQARERDEHFSIHPELWGFLQREPMLAKVTLKIHVIMIKPQCALVLSALGGNRASSTVLTMNVQHIAKFPQMMIVRRPSLSTNNIIKASAIRPMTELIACYLSA
jgi:hypothetical protein